MSYADVPDCTPSATGQSTHFPLAYGKPAVTLGEFRLMEEDRYIGGLVEAVKSNPYCCGRLVKNRKRNDSEQSLMRQALAL